MSIFESHNNSVEENEGAKVTPDELVTKLYGAYNNETNTVDDTAVMEVATYIIDDTNKFENEEKIQLIAALNHFSKEVARRQTNKKESNQAGVDIPSFIADAIETLSN